MSIREKSPSGVQGGMIWSCPASRVPMLCFGARAQLMAVCGFHLDRPSYWEPTPDGLGRLYGRMTAEPDP